MKDLIKYHNMLGVKELLKLFIVINLLLTYKLTRAIYKAFKYTFLYLLYIEIKAIKYTKFQDLKNNI